MSVQNNKLEDMLEDIGILKGTDKSCALKKFMKSLDFIKENKEFNMVDIQRYLKCGYGTACKVCDALVALCVVEKRDTLPMFKVIIIESILEKLENNEIKRIKLEKEVDEILVELNMNPYEKRDFLWVKEAILLAINNPKTWNELLLEKLGKKVNITRERVRQILEKAVWNNWTRKSSELLVERLGAFIKFDFEYSKPHYGEVVEIILNYLREKYKI